MMQTTTATDAYVRNHAEALCLLEEIEEMVRDLPAPDFGGFTPTWGHVGDLELLIKRLREAGTGSTGPDLKAPRTPRPASAPAFLVVLGDTMSE